VTGVSARNTCLATVTDVMDVSWPTDRQDGERRIREWQFPYRRSYDEGRVDVHQQPRARAGLPGQRLRHPLESGVTTGQFVDLMRCVPTGSEAESSVRLLATGSTEMTPGEGEWTGAGREVIAHLRSQGL